MGNCCRVPNYFPPPSSSSTVPHDEPLNTTKTNNYIVTVEENKNNEISQPTVQNASTHNIDSIPVNLPSPNSHLTVKSGRHIPVDENQIGSRDGSTELKDRR